MNQIEIVMFMILHHQGNHMILFTNEIILYRSVSYTL